MDNVDAINVRVISKRFLYRYYPVFVFYTFLISIVIKIILKNNSEGIFNFFMMLTITVLMYLFIMIPLIVFKPVKSSSRRIAMILFSLIFTGIFIIIQSWFLSRNPSIGFVNSSQLIKILGESLLLGGIFICWFFYIEEKQYIAEQRIIAERNSRIKNEKMVMETHLKLLQAQIEPHFLFNTLTSIFSLTDEAPQKAMKMHNNFMQYLKTTLLKTRSNVTTIGQEIELIKAYLDIFKVRMGKRLQYSIETDDIIRDLPFPSMLIQPIVENAVKHGLEPKIEGGEIRIKVSKKEKNRLCWEIEDTGLGMSDTSHLGTGISNVMERVEALYGKEGSLEIKVNHPSGVRAILEIPYV